MRTLAAHKKYRDLPIDFIAPVFVGGGLGFNPIPLIHLQRVFKVRWKRVESVSFMFHVICGILVTILPMTAYVTGVGADFQRQVGFQRIAVGMVLR